MTKSDGVGDADVDMETEAKKPEPTEAAADSEQKKVEEETKQEEAEKKELRKTQMMLLRVSWRKLRFIVKTGILTLVTGGYNLRNNPDRYGHVYIFLMKKKKENFFEKCLSVRKIEIIECCFFCLILVIFQGCSFKGVYLPNLSALNKDCG